MARPKIVWTDKDYRTFEGLCGVQCTRDEICSIMNVDHKTLDRLCKAHYIDENGAQMGFSPAYIKYSAGGKMSLRRAQFRLAEKSAAMAIWLGKQYLGQKDVPDESFDTEDTDSYFDKAGL